MKLLKFNNRYLLIYLPKRIVVDYNFAHVSLVQWKYVCTNHQLFSHFYLYRNISGEKREPRNLEWHRFFDSRSMDN